MYILWPRIYCISSRLALAHSSGSSSSCTCLVPVLMNNPSYPLCILCFLPLCLHFQLLPILSQQTTLYRCAVRSLSSIMLLASTRACRCVPVHLIRILISACLPLVTVRTLVLTSPDLPSSHAANPNMHKSVTVVHVPVMAMILAPHLIFGLTSVSAQSRNSEREPLAGRNHDVGLPDSNNVSQFIPCRLTRKSQ